ncbi:MAG: hypothetical protein ACR2J9_09935 [Gaiellales bacterium]
MHRRLLPLALLALALTAALGLTACGGSDGTTFDDAGAPFTFQYPKDLHKVYAKTGREIQGLPPKYKVALGTDETNVVVVAYYQLPKDVSKLKKSALAVAVARSARALSRALNGTIPKSTSTQMGDLPATQFEFSTQSKSLTTRLVYAFQGKQQYFLRCQWNADGADAIPSACDQVASSFSPN